MFDRRKLFVGVIASAVAISLLGVNAALASVAAPVPYLSGVSGTGTTVNPQLAKFTVTAGAPIPSKIASTAPYAVYGYAWANTGTGNALVVAIHPSFADSNQNPLGWHPHIVQLAPGGSNGDDFCIVGITHDTTAGITISGNTMNVNIRTSQLPAGESASSLNTIVGFVVQGDASCTSGLGVAVTT